MKAKLINLALTKANGRYFVASRELPGLYVTGSTEEEALGSVPEAIRVMFLADGIDVVVSEVEAPETSLPAPWVAVPVRHAA
jgi:predicted RNase H-like HicB family nuclease